MTVFILSLHMMYMLLPDEATVNGQALSRFASPIDTGELQVAPAFVETTAYSWDVDSLGLVLYAMKNEFPEMFTIGAQASVVPVDKVVVLLKVAPLFVLYTASIALLFPFVSQAARTLFPSAAIQGSAPQQPVMVCFVQLEPAFDET